MARDKYFDLRQSTRAYHNPYEAGGVGVGGLTESARYNRQQVGSSYLSAPTGVNTWSKRPSSRSMGRSGMADMPTDGPTPRGGPPDRPQKMGPAGPSAMAGGVAGRFERPSESTWAPTGESGASLMRSLSIPVGGAINVMRERKERKKAKDLAAMNADYDMGATLKHARRNRGIRMSDLKRESDKPEIAGPNDTMVGKRTGFHDLPTAKERVDKVLRIAGQNRPDPSLYGSGQSLEDINLNYGLPTSGLGALGAGDPTIERPASSIDMTESMGRSSYPPLGGPESSPIPMEATPVDRVLMGARRNRPDPSLYGSGQRIEDINLSAGLPTPNMRVIEGGDPTIDQPASDIGTTESMGRSRFGPLREPTGGPIPVGGVPDPVMTPDVLSSQPRALPSGNQRRVNQRVDEPQAPGPGPETGLPRPAAVRSGRTKTRPTDAERERQERNRSNIPPNWR